MTMTSVKKLMQVTYEKKNGKLIIHDEAAILIPEDNNLRGMTEIPTSISSSIATSKDKSCEDF